MSGILFGVLMIGLHMAPNAAGAGLQVYRDGGFILMRHHQCIVRNVIVPCAEDLQKAKPHLR